jgi:VWFA-related protein
MVKVASRFLVQRLGGVALSASWSAGPLPSRLNGIVCLCLLAGALVTAQNQSSAPQEPTFRAGIQSVRVDLYATKDGKPVTDLRADEIELFEDGVPHAVQTFERIAVAAHTAATPADSRSLAERRRMASDPRYRLFVVFVPLAARNPLPAAVQYRERAGLIQELNGLLGPDDLVAVMTSDMRVDELTFERRLPLTTVAWPSQSADPRYALWDACYPAAFPGSPNGEMKARYQELMTFEALDALIAHLGGLRDERKHVLVLTDGFRLYQKNPTLTERGRPGTPAGTPTTGGSTPAGLVPRLGESAGSMISSKDCESDLRDLATLDHAHRLDNVAAHARLNNVSLYPIMPAALSGLPTRRPTGGSFNPNAFRRQDALRGLAEDTDGLAIVNENEVAENLTKMMASTAAYYLLSYTPTNAAVDGKFRRIAVKVKRPNTHVRARPGYVATTLNMTPAELRPAAPVETIEQPDAVSSALSELTRTTPGALHLRPVSWTRDSGSGSRTSALWVVGELDSQLRGKAPWTNGGSAEIVLKPLAGGEGISRKAELSPMNLVVEFDMPLAPGTYSMQLQLAAPAGEPVGDLMRLTIPVAPAPLGEPMVSRRSNSPGQQFTRTADLRFRKTESVRFELPTTSGEAASARLLDTKGGPLSVPAHVSDRPDSSGAFRWLVVDLPVTPLAPAYYAVEVKQGPATRVTAFRVVP